MKTELTTTVGQLAVDQGQVSPNAPNARAIEPGDAKGNLYLLLELSGPETGRTRLYRQVLNEVQNAFYQVPGNIADVLHNSVSRAHSIIQAANAAQPSDRRWRGGISCVALYRDHVYLGQAGPALVLVTHPTTVEMFPADSSPPPVALGDADAPMVDLYHTRIEPDNLILLLESGWLLHTDVETLAGVTTAPNVHAVLDVLADVAGGARLTALAIGTQAAPAAQPARAASTSQVAATAAARPPAPPPPVGDVADWEQDKQWWEEAATTAPVAATPAKPTATGPAPAAGLAAAGSAMLQGSRRLVEGMLPDKAGATQPAPAAAKTAATTTTPKKPRQPRSRPTAAPAGRSRWPMILALVIIPIIILGLVGLMYLLRGRDRENRFQGLVQDARAAVASAAGLEETQARTRLTAALENVNEALILKPGDADALQLQDTVQTELNRVNRVVPLYLVAPLKEFTGTDRDLGRVLVNGGDIYVLDRGRDTVERFRLNNLGDGLQPDEGGVVIERGKTVGSTVVGELVDMVWASPAGARTQAALLILDSNGTIFEYQPPWELKVRPVAMRDMWQQPRLASTYAGNLYLLDSGLQQVLRYRPGSDLSYTEAPDQYFPPETPVDLSSVQDMGIDGNVWTLFPNGNVGKYLSGKSEPFSLQGLPAPLERPTSLFVGVDGNAPANNLYLTDGGPGVIHQFDKTGQFLRQFREADGNQLAGLRSLFVDEAAAKFYALTGSGLFQMDIPR